MVLKNHKRNKANRADFNNTFTHCHPTPPAPWYFQCIDSLVRPRCNSPFMSSQCERRCSRPPEGVFPSSRLVWQTPVSSHSLNITVASLQPDCSCADLLYKGGSPGPAPSLPHCIKHWWSCKGRLEPVSCCGLDLAFSQSLFLSCKLSPSISFFSPLSDSYHCFCCGYLNVVEWSRLHLCQKRHQIWRNESDKCLLLLLLPVASQSKRRDFLEMTVCVCLFDSCIRISCLCAVHLCYALWLTTEYG